MNVGVADARRPRARQCARWLRRGFATRDEKIVAEGYGHFATNILTYIDKFDKRLPGMREAYDFLSEWAQPNGSGHFFTFGELDKKTGKVTFHDAAPRVRGIEGHIVTCFMLIGLMEGVLDTFKEAVPILAEVDKGQGPWIDVSPWGDRDNR